MHYSTPTRSRNYIVVPRDVPPENFLFVPETRKERKLGLGRCLLVPLVISILTGVVVVSVGYFVYKYTVPGEIVEWPIETDNGIHGGHVN